MTTVTVVGKFGKGVKRGGVTVEIVANPSIYAYLGKNYLERLIENSGLVVSNKTYGSRGLMMQINPASIPSLSNHVTYNADQFTSAVKSMLALSERTMRYHYPFVFDELEDIVQSDIGYRTVGVDDDVAYSMYFQLELSQMSEAELTFKFRPKPSVEEKLGSFERGWGKALSFEKSNLVGEYILTLPRPVIIPAVYFKMVAELLNHEISEALTIHVDYEEDEQDEKEKSEYPRFAHLGRKERKEAIALEEEFHKSEYRDW